MCVILKVKQLDTYRFLYQGQLTVMKVSKYKEEFDSYGQRKVCPKLNKYRRWAIIPYSNKGSLARRLMREKENQPITKADLQTILNHITSERYKVENYVHDEIEKVNNRVDVLRSDVNELKTDMKQVKKDIVELKTDVNELKTDMKQVKKDVNTIASDLGYVRDENQQLKSA